MIASLVPIRSVVPRIHQLLCTVALCSPLFVNDHALCWLTELSKYWALLQRRSKDFFVFCLGHLVHFVVGLQGHLDHVRLVTRYDRPSLCLAWIAHIFGLNTENSALVCDLLNCIAVGIIYIVLSHDYLSVNDNIDIRVIVLIPRNWQDISVL